MTGKELARYIDHTALKPDVKRETIKKLCEEAVKYGFPAVCCNPAHVKFAAGLLKDTPVKVCTVIGFPLGANTPEVKAFETSDAIRNGAEELDMVINISAVKDGDYDLVENDIRAVIGAATGKTLVKVIIETCLLTDDEKIKVCQICKKLKVGFVKTSTGFSTGGATVEDIKLMKETVGDGIGVKASSGIKTRESAMRMIEAGATRIGTSSGVRIIEEIGHTSRQAIE